MALLDKDGNKGRIGTPEIGFDFWYRALTVAEYSRLKGSALWDEGNPHKIDFVRLAELAVTKIGGFPEPYSKIETIDELLALGVDTEGENASFIAESAWAMGWEIWQAINGISKKKLSLADSPESRDSPTIGRKKLSRLFRGLHRT
jgi:hypothetical protein